MLKFGEDHFSNEKCFLRRDGAGPLNAQQPSFIAVCCKAYIWWRFSLGTQYFLRMLAKKLLYLFDGCVTVCPGCKYYTMPTSFRSKDFFSKISNHPSPKHLSISFYATRTIPFAFVISLCIRSCYILLFLVITLLTWLFITCIS